MCSWEMLQETIHLAMKDVLKYVFPANVPIKLGLLSGKPGCLSSDSWTAAQGHSMAQYSGPVRENAKMPWSIQILDAQILNLLDDIMMPCSMF